MRNETGTNKAGYNVGEAYRRQRASRTVCEKRNQYRLKVLTECEAENPRRIARREVSRLQCHSGIEAQVEPSKYRVFSLKKAEKNNCNRPPLSPVHISNSLQPSFILHVRPHCHIWKRIRSNRLLLLYR